MLTLVLVRHATCEGRTTRKFVGQQISGVVYLWQRDNGGTQFTCAALYFLVEEVVTLVVGGGLFIVLSVPQLLF